jgi:hypothetical protein
MFQPIASSCRPQLIVQWQTRGALIPLPAGPLGDLVNPILRIEIKDVIICGLLRLDSRSQKFHVIFRVLEVCFASLLFALNFTAEVVSLLDVSHHSHSFYYRLVTIFHSFSVLVF